MAPEHSRVTQLSTSAKRLDHSLKPPEKLRLQLCYTLCVGSRTDTQVAARHLMLNCGVSLPHTCRHVRFRDYINCQ